ncbi:MAG: hypothetical protein ACJAZX_000407 [Rickettsiales bacterium]|jgi:hypothetical protein
MPEITQNNQLTAIKTQLLNNIKIYLQHNKEEIADLRTIDIRTQINGEFFDDFLVGHVLFYIPIDLKDIFNLCLEEPNIICEIARFNTIEPSTLTIIKDAIYFYLKDYVYRQMPELIRGILTNKMLPL